jgi:hypothetical protein
MDVLTRQDIPLAAHSQRISPTEAFNEYPVNSHPSSTDLIAPLLSACK